MRIVIDAKDTVAGRLASKIARELLSGKTVAVINAEQSVISGDPNYTISAFRAKIDRGDPYRGPFYPRTPERMLRRIVRGMLPYHQARGKTAYKRLRVFTGIPADLTAAKPVRIPDAENRLDTKFLTLGVLAERLGAAKRW